jgi:hypothetical protein
MMVLGAVLWLLPSVGARGSQNVMLGWNPEIGQGVAGYVLYYGPASGHYSSRMNVGTNTTATVPALPEGTTNFFAVTAYNVAGVESPKSAEVRYVVPAALALTLGRSAGATATVSFAVALGHWYEVQATQDFKTWITIGETVTLTTNGQLQVSDPASRMLRYRFYRLAIH